MKRNSLYLCLFFISITLFIFAVSSHIDKNKLEEEATQKSALTFSNTQEWNPILYSEATAPPNPLFRDITLPSPPSNISEETQEELALLHTYTHKRTPEKIEEIESEIQLHTVQIGSSTVEKMLEVHTQTDALITYSLELTEPMIVYQKKYFDRVRPSLLDPSLTVAIEIPNHPAYPSGHSTQIHLIQKILTDLDPQNSEVYKVVAERVARNREIAGVHYPSDSKAGEILAEELYKRLQNDEIFLSLMTKAKQEW